MDVEVFDVPRHSPSLDSTCTVAYGWLHSSTYSPLRIEGTSVQSTFFVLRSKSSRRPAVLRQRYFCIPPAHTHQWRLGVLLRHGKMGCICRAGPCALLSGLSLEAPIPGQVRHQQHNSCDNLNHHLVPIPTRYHVHVRPPCSSHASLVTDILCCCCWDTWIGMMLDGTESTLQSVPASHSPIVARAMLQQLLLKAPACHALPMRRIVCGLDRVRQHPWGLQKMQPGQTIIGYVKNKIGSRPARGAHLALTGWPQGYSWCQPTPKRMMLTWPRNCGNSLLSLRASRIWSFSRRLASSQSASSSHLPR